MLKAKTQQGGLEDRKQPLTVAGGSGIARPDYRKSKERVSVNIPRHGPPHSPLQEINGTAPMLSGANL